MKGALSRSSKVRSSPGLHLVAENRRVPLERARMGPRIGIQQQLVWIEAMPGLGLIGTVDAIAVECAGSDIRKIAVKDLVGVFRQLDAARARVSPVRSNMTDLDLGRVGGKEREVGAFAVPVAPKGLGRPSSIDLTGMKPPTPNAPTTTAATANCCTASAN